jgi:hypothetical protein
MDILNVNYSPKSSKWQVYSKSTIKFDFGLKTKRNSKKFLEKVKSDKDSQSLKLLL